VVWPKFNAARFGVVTTVRMAGVVNGSVANGLDITEEEAEIYDRQLRVWGVDVQRRCA
jgi:hypothetical protein